MIASPFISVLLRFHERHEAGILIQRFNVHRLVAKDLNENVIFRHNQKSIIHNPQSFQMLQTQPLKQLIQR